jgi:N-ethylmaleimide reductase
MVAEYYAQRAGAAIIFTETVAWCQRGRSSTGSGNLFTEEQAEGWKKVTDKVHENNGRIFVQINHAGRATNTDKTGGL